MSAAADTTNNENVLTQKKGNHKGCPYDGLAGGYFLGNEGGRLVFLHTALDKCGAVMATGHHSCCSPMTSSTKSCKASK